MLIYSQCTYLYYTTESINSYLLFCILITIMLMTLWGHNYPAGWGICGPLLYTVIIKKIINKIRVITWEDVNEWFANHSKPHSPTIINVEGQVHQSLADTHFVLTRMHDKGGQIMLSYRLCTGGHNYPEARV